MKRSRESKKRLAQERLEEKMGGALVQKGNCSEVYECEFVDLGSPPGVGGVRKPYIMKVVETEQFCIMELACLWHLEKSGIVPRIRMLEFAPVSTTRHNKTKIVMDKRGVSLMKKHFDSVDEVADVMRQMIACVLAVWRTGIAHRDLKLENFVIDAENNVTIIDFGWSCIRTKPCVIKRGRDTMYTFCYRPPELSAKTTHVTLDTMECERFVLGMCLLYMSTCNHQNFKWPTKVQEHRDLLATTLGAMSASDPAWLRRTDTFCNARGKPLIDSHIHPELARRHPYLREIIVGLLRWNPADRATENHIHAILQRSGVVLRPIDIGAGHIKEALDLGPGATVELRINMAALAKRNKLRVHPFIMTNLALAILLDKAFKREACPESATTYARIHDVVNMPGAVEALYTVCCEFSNSAVGAIPTRITDALPELVKYFRAFVSTSFVAVDILKQTLGRHRTVNESELARIAMYAATREAAHSHRFGEEVDYLVRKMEDGGSIGMPDTVEENVHRVSEVCRCLRCLCA